MVVVLAGGVGGSKFLTGIAQIRKKAKAIINTGDDIERFGLYISPDIDINLYSLANVIHEQGWGFKNESYQCQTVLTDIYKQQCWFNLGDKDLATHIYRTHLLKQGKTLSEITADMCDKWNVPIEIFPMTDDRITTYIETENGIIHFQEYLIQRKMSDRVIDIILEGKNEAKPAPGILENIEKADMIIFAPSNPLVSIGPILSVPGITTAIKKSKAKVAAISPIIAGGVIKGPADRMMKSLGMNVSPLGIADYYGDLLDAIVIDEQDAVLNQTLKEKGLHVLVTDTIMDSNQKKKLLAKQVIDWVEHLT